MDSPALTDKNQFPTDEMIYFHIGRSTKLWTALFEYIHKHHPDFIEVWRYYQDGKRWLMNVSRKKKTVFWLSIFKGSFRITFYFTEKAREPISACTISPGLKKQFTTGKQYNKIRGITIMFKNKKDVEDAKSLIALKLSIK